MGWLGENSCKMSVYGAVPSCMSKKSSWVSSVLCPTTWTRRFRVTTSLNGEDEEGRRGCRESKQWSGVSDILEGPGRYWPILQAGGRDSMLQIWPINHHGEKLFGEHVNKINKPHEENGGIWYCVVTLDVLILVNLLQIVPYCFYELIFSAKRSISRCVDVSIDLALCRKGSYK